MDCDPEIADFNHIIPCSFLITTGPILCTDLTLHMPAGRKPLSAELKAQRRQASLKRYAERYPYSRSAIPYLKEVMVDIWRPVGPRAVNACKGAVLKLPLAMDRRTAQAYRDRKRDAMQEDAMESTRRSTLRAEQQRPTPMTAHKPAHKMPSPAAKSTPRSRGTAPVVSRKKPGHLLSMDNAAIDQGKGKAGKRGKHPPLETPCPTRYHNDDDGAGSDSGDGEDGWGDHSPRPPMRSFIREPTPHCEACGEAYCCGCSCMCTAPTAVWWEHGRHMKGTYD
ncbi:hypothetical protein C8R43DRAFT_1138529 [Mycena crocata]|nr:hypothetical protein C8R43DRAFT_1138529 [Mycena crocata]